jgi:hypothetical protein
MALTVYYNYDNQYLTKLKNYQKVGQHHFISPSAEQAETLRKKVSIQNTERRHAPSHEETGSYLKIPLPDLHRGPWYGSNG